MMALQSKNWNPYMKSVSAKLKRNWKGFEDMTNERIKNPGTLKPGTTGYDILYILKQYGNYPEEKIKELIPDKKPDTIRKSIRKLEDCNYLLRRRGIGGEYILSLTRFSKEMLMVQNYNLSTSPKKLTRAANLAVVSMMFHKSVLPYDTNAAEFYESKEDILKKYPESEKVLIVSRMAGIYHHYDEIIPVFFLGSSMYWVDNSERTVKEYIENRLYHKPINTCFFFIENYEKEAMRLVNEPDGGRNYGVALRESLELSSCYQKAFLFSTDRPGINQLKLFRSFSNIEELYLDAVFERNERELSADSVIDGRIDETDCIVLFSGDIIRIKRIYRLLDARMLDRINIICFDFQEYFLRAAFSRWSNQVIINSYSTHDLMEVFNIGGVEY